jgi:F420-dependent oxidoreductase-like protein
VQFPLPMKCSSFPRQEFVRILSSVQFSVWPSQSESWDDLSTLVRYADDNGWYGVWLADHFMPSTYSSPKVTSNTEATSGPVIECLSVLAGLAAVTSRVRLGSLVLGNTYRHPAVVAKQASAIDRISGGRFVLGLGAGWQENEHLAYGIELPSVKDRLARFEEACTIVRSLLDEDRTTFDGNFYQIRNAPNDPKPVQRRLPLLVGGGGERVVLRIAALHGSEWNTWGTPEVMNHKSRVLDRHCEEVGRDPDDIWRSAQALFLVDRPGEGFEARRAQLEATQLPVIAGPAGELQESIKAYQDAGMDEVIVHQIALGYGPGRIDTLAGLYEDVFSAFAEA